MASNKGWDRFLFTQDGNKITNGAGSSILEKGEFGIFSIWDVISTGATAVETFTAAKVYEFKVGKQGTNLSLRSNSDKAYSSFPFKLADVIDVGVRRPSELQTFDSLLVGYDGADADTAFAFINGQSKELSILLSGEPMGLLGYLDAEVEVKIHFTPPAGDDCTTLDDCTAATALPIVTAAAAVFNAITLMGGVPITNYITATVVDSGGDLTAIRFVGKPVVLAANDECLRDELPFINTSTKISIAGGYPLRVGENFIIKGDKFSAKLESMATDLEGLGGNLWDLEERARVYFGDEHKHVGNNYAKWALGEESVLSANVQYSDYYFTVRRVKSSQSFAGEGVETITYHIGAPATSATFTSVHDTAVTLLSDNFTADSAVVKTADGITTYDTVISVASEAFTSVHDSPVQLDNTDLLATSVVVKSADLLTTYVVTTDYTIDAANGTITVLSTGNMANTTAFDVAYSTDGDYVVDYTAKTITVVSTGAMADDTSFLINYSTDLEVLLDAFAEAASFDGIILA